MRYNSQQAIGYSCIERKIHNSLPATCANSASRRGSVAQRSFHGEASADELAHLHGAGFAIQIRRLQCSTQDKVPRRAVVHGSRIRKVGRIRRDRRVG
ncbi:MAG: hypothetical protein HDT42_08900 [Ruminococcaceae bacterium]|nr:hypothetical protein [Oscillospiraceae bacterium]